MREGDRLLNPDEYQRALREVDQRALWGHIRAMNEIHHTSRDLRAPRGWTPETAPRAATPSIPQMVADLERTDLEEAEAEIEP